MKIHYQFFIALFIVLFLFMVRDDVLSVIENIYNKNNDNQVIQLEKEVPILGKVDTPGALLVDSNLLNTDSKTKLLKDNIITITNKYRKENGGLSLLAENSKLNLSAEKKLQDMFDNQYFEHLSPSDIGVADLGEQVGYEYIFIGENLAMGNFKNDQALVDAWMASPGHKENILNKNYIEIGVAVEKSKFEGSDVWIAVQHFGTPRNICPSIDMVLYGVIDSNQSQLKEIERDLLLRKDMIEKKVVYEGMTYFEQIDKYNNLINNYNKLITETKEKINNYNNQVRAFNLCLFGNQ